MNVIGTRGVWKLFCWASERNAISHEVLFSPNANYCYRSCLTLLLPPKDALLVNSLCTHSSVLATLRGPRGIIIHCVNRLENCWILWMGTFFFNAHSSQEKMEKAFREPYPDGRIDERDIFFPALLQNTIYERTKISAHQLWKCELSGKLAVGRNT